MKVAIIGAGGIGGYIGGRLAEAGCAVTLVARGRQLEAIQKGGLFIESPLGSAHARDIPATDVLDGFGLTRNLAVGGLASKGVAG